MCLCVLPHFIKARHGPLSRLRGTDRQHAVVHFPSSTNPATRLALFLSGVMLRPPEPRPVKMVPLDAKTLKELPVKFKLHWKQDTVCVWMYRVYHIGQIHTCGRWTNTQAALYNNKLRKNMKQAYLSDEKWECTWTHINVRIHIVQWADNKYLNNCSREIFFNFAVITIVFHSIRTSLPCVTLLHWCSSPGSLHGDENST